jgi:putative glycosyltransferase (TIGR04348 family)
MKIGLVAPENPAAWSGNRVTAERWARILRGLGHRVALGHAYDGDRLDLLVALHARRTAAAVARFHRDHPGAPVVVAMTGTDLYGDLRRSAAARRSLRLASRVVVLQPRGLAALPSDMRGKARVIRQSAKRPRGRQRRRRDVFEVCVLSHLRPVKDPLRAARAARLLPPESRVHVVHLGAAWDPGWAARARREASRNPRYCWLGERPQSQALRVLARSRLLAVTSRLEGGANVVSEALAAGVPVVASRIEGSVGLLGAGYPGYFPAGDTRALATLLQRVETDAAFRSRLERWCRRLAPLVHPTRERRAWRELLAELSPAAARPRRRLKDARSGTRRSLTVMSAGRSIPGIRQGIGRSR